MIRKDVWTLPKPASVPSTGPNTNAQLLTLQHLEAIAKFQESGIISAEAKSQISALPDRSQDNQPSSRKPFGVARVPWLVVILLVQAALSLRLVWSNTAFSDEALYLWTGRLEWAHWLHGTPIQTESFPTYFSGAPVVYPPIGAIADRLGGLAGARLLSLVFMLIASGLLYGTACHIFDRRTALFATALFVATPATEFLGAFATYDGFALALLALATWIGVRSARRPVSGQFALLAASGAVLGLADAAKYAAALFDPVVIAVIAFAALREGGRSAFGRALTVTTVTLGVFVGVGLRLGGSAYWQGINFTTLNRSGGSYSALGIVTVSFDWLIFVLPLAFIGAAVVICQRRDAGSRGLAVALVLAVILAPAEQARIHTITSLFKHVGYGAWFGCIVGGLALSALAGAVPAHKTAKAIAVSASVVIVAVIPGSWIAADHYQGWPNLARAIADFRPIVASTHGLILASDSEHTLEYYFPVATHRDKFASTWWFYYVDPSTRRHLSGDPAYVDAIRHRDFAAIFITQDPEDDSPGVDATIDRAIEHYGGYRLTASIPYTAGSVHSSVAIWVRDGK